MAKRSFKFYRRNEADVMNSLGFKPTKNSGSTWIEKEDGQNDFLICQLKSTDAQSIKINQKDIRILEANAISAHKLPCFAIQFLNTGEVWLMAKPIDFEEIAKYIRTGKCEVSESIVVEDQKQRKIKSIKSSENARTAFHQERERKFKKEKKAW